MSNLEIHLLTGNLQKEKMDYIYAKVTGGKEDKSGFYIHFTAVSPEVENILQTWVIANS
ncbi:hypothetical protein [Okeania sp. SIO2C2]|uniref:hypothetical protein n=1 Tax=Okeania sp. SIO2C2 TaxID=2607787 RepID=UPI002579B19E|nr:hypothetical protein [Okeania sp. SIO2C2]